ncbi:MAG: hypothetical protein EOP45_01785 [Sphingobacteriaceae bacterium]|nr:MAG: hypothetical protein EOP45_01785 [Sphingobacteriaceae bacterium]
MKNYLYIFSILFLGIVFFTPISSKAQFLSDQVTGRPITAKSYTDIQGSPYLNDNWSKGIVKLNNGETYKDNLYLKYNLLNDELYFKGKNDETLAFVNGVKEFTINTNDKDGTLQETHYKNGFKNIPGYTDNTNFEVLAEGTVTLIKKVSVFISETKEFNSAVTNKKFEQNSKYFILIGTTGKQIKNDKNSVLKILPDKQSEVESYIKKNNLKFKTDEDLSQTVKYYNSL